MTTGHPRRTSTCSPSVTFRPSSSSPWATPSSSTDASVNNWLEAALADVHVDVAFLGTNGFSVSRGMTTPDESDAMAKRAMSQAARRTVVVTSSTKAGLDHFHRFARPEDVALLITDTHLDDETVEQFEAAGTDVVRT